MIKEKEIQIKGNSNNVIFYRNKDYDIKIGEVIYIKVSDLAKTSKYKITAICDICGNEKKISYFSYNRNYEKYELYTCQKCSTIKNKKTNQEKYGVDFPIQNTDIKNKRIKTNQEKYGVDYYQQLDETKEKVKKTKTKKYNNENYNNIKQIQNTKKERYGDENYNNRIKCTETNIEKYGVNNVSQNTDIKNKKRNTYKIHYNVDNYSKYIQNKKHTIYIRKI